MTLALCLMGRADDAAGVRDQVSRVATALSEGNAAGAMAPFDKSYASYDKLRGFFSGLTRAFQIVNEIDIQDEEDGKTQVTVNVHWTLTLTDIETNYTENRSADLDIRLIRVKGKWKIADLQPVDLFNPAGQRAPKPPS